MFALQMASLLFFADPPFLVTSLLSLLETQFAFIQVTQSSTLLASLSLLASSQHGLLILLDLQRCQPSEWLSMMTLDLHLLRLAVASVSPFVHRIAAAQVPLSSLFGLLTLCFCLLVLRSICCTHLSECLASSFLYSCHPCRLHLLCFSTLISFQC